VTTAETATQARLPTPGRTRWQPLRCGMVELFHYDAEEFWFRDGRLLLRGNNGTGKSKVLALTLPFLLDGDHRPQRVEPDGDPAKRMEWNLLLDGRHTDRIGYTWIEFGRLDGEHDGAARYLTLGCGLKAVAGKGIAQKWFFVTPQRMGEDLYLVDGHRIVLGRDRLRDALGDGGEVIEGVEAYRRTVDERLFGLGGERYDALVRLLVQLRQPQLSKRPDERALSRALTEALPPLDQAVVDHVAQAMRALEQDRHELRELGEVREAVHTFAGRYRTYARVATKRRETAVRKVNSAYERTAGELHRAEESKREAGAREASLRAERQRTAAALAGLREAERTLRSSPEMRDAARLEGAADRAERARRAHEETAGELDRVQQRLRDARRRSSEAEAGAADARERLDGSAARAASAADRAGVLAGHRDVLRPVLGGLDQEGGVPDPLPERDAERLAARRAEALGRVRQLAGEVLAAEAARAEAQRRHAEAASQHDAAGEALTSAEAALEDAGTAYVRAVEAYATATTELRLDRPDLLLESLASWVTGAEGPNPAVAAVSAAAQDVVATLSAEDAALAAGQAALEAAAAAVREERDRLASGAQPIPPPAATRDAEVREQQPGAPFWQLVEFADGVDEVARAGLEAALEASGLLDA
jgi:uncharacterized protein (TIGR02680 family)